MDGSGLAIIRMVTSSTVELSTVNLLHLNLFANSAPPEFSPPFLKKKKKCQFLARYWEERRNGTSEIDAMVTPRAEERTLTNPRSNLDQESGKELRSPAFHSR